MFNIKGSNFLYYSKMAIFISIFFVGIIGCSESQDSSNSQEREVARNLLKIVKIMPFDGEQEVLKDSIIAVQFNGEIDASQIPKNSISLDNGVKGMVAISGSLLSFTPENDLKTGQTYVATVKAGIKSKDNKIFKKEYSWSFVTKSINIDEKKDQDIKIISVLPKAESINVSVNQKIRVEFNHEMDAFSVKKSGFTLMNLNSKTAVPGTLNFVDKILSFVPKQSLNYGVRYKATINNGSHALSGEKLTLDFSWYFSTIEKPEKWGPAVPLEKNYNSAGRYPKVKVDGKGNGIVIWQQESGVWYSIYKEETGWEKEASFPRTVNLYTNPSLSINKEGEAIAVWVAWGNNQRKIYFSLFNFVSQKWTKVKEVPGTESKFVSFPKVVINENGNALLIYNGNGPNESKIIKPMAYFYEKGKGWNNGISISLAKNVSVDKTDFDLNNKDEAMAVWTECSQEIKVHCYTDDSYRTIWTNNFNLKSGWKKPKKIVDQLDWHANLPKVALNDSGKALVIWDRFNKSDQRDIWSIDFDPKNSWGKVVSLESIPGSAAGTMVKLDSKGRGLSFWWQYDQTNKRSIYSSTYLPSKGWGKPTLLENFSGHSGDGCIDLNESGKAVAVWWQRNPQMKDLVGASFSFVKGWGKAKLLEQNNAGDVNYFPKVSINDQGAALSAWQQSDGIRDHVWANRFF